MAQYIPVMLNLEKRRCVIIGGGAVAERKALPLLDAGADVLVISPAVTEVLKKLSADGRITWSRRSYQAGDLKGAFLAFAATDQPVINEAVLMEAEALGIPVNHTADGSRGSFITPSFVRRGGLVVAVSTSGAGPSVSRALSHEIDLHYGEDYERYVDFLSFARTIVKKRVQDAKLRARLFKALTEMDILTEIRNGSFRPWSEEELTSWIEGYREE